MLAFILMMIGAIISGYFGPWWAPAGFVVLLSLLMHLPIRQAMLIGFLSLLLVYGMISLLMLGKDASGLIGKTGALLGGLSAPLMVIVTAITGGVTGLVSGWLGSSLGKVMPTKI